MNEKIAIIIPTYNRPLALRNCIQSILRQTVLPAEVIVIDDGNLSVYPLEDECISAGIDYKYYKKQSPGLTESRNLGIKMATGEIIFFVSSNWFQRNQFELTRIFTVFFHQIII